MSLFNWFRSSSSLNTTEHHVIPEVQNPQVTNETPAQPATIAVDDHKGDNMNGLITIKYGTGMPIDIIYGFLKKDFEEQGYQDALVNADVKYRESKEAIIVNDLRNLFTQISLRYKQDIRLLEVRIANAKEAYAMSSASLLEAQKQTYEEHLTEIHDMESRLEAKDSTMLTMIESYKRGFFKGVAAMTEQFLNNK